MAIARYRAEALAEVYRRHAGSVFGLARRVLGGDSARGEEVTQEVFLKLWNFPDKFDPDRGSLRSFLLSSAHSRAVDMLRSDSARRRRETADLKRTAQAGYDLEREVWDLAVADNVRGALSRLPEPERDAIQLAYFGGRTYREVAAELGAPEGTVKSRIRSGLSRLRDDLTASGVISE
jgi:RNA polymerase sigma-70 factor (ECF subfamily)